MKDRLLKFLEEESLTAAKFAEEIGVQPSSISHILSGRNNPGYDFFQKILKRYPHINAEWLITGNGKMTKTPQQASLFSAEFDKTQVKTEDKISFPTAEALSYNKSDSNKNNLLPEQEKLNLPDNIATKSVEKVLILYSDKSFREYLPAK